jgi:hypothetical protein
MRGHFPKHSESPSVVYSRLKRAKYVFRFFRTMAALGPQAFEATKSAHVGRTYGMPTETVKRIKARFRNELSIGGPDGK